MLGPCNGAVSKSGAWLPFRRECSDGGGQQKWGLAVGFKQEVGTE